MGVARALVTATHPVPTVAVTAFAVATAASAGLRARRTGLLAAAVLTGQLCIGWSNDWLDRDRDSRAGRLDKPIPRGDVPAATVGTGAVLAGAACVPLSVLLGRRAGGAHLAAVASGLGYNLGLKATPLSPLPYFVTFALLPPWVAALSLPGTPAPRSGVWVAAGVLGVSAHFANTVGDADADAATSVRGLPQLLGPARSILVSGSLLAAAAPLLLVGTRVTPVTAAAVAGSVTAAAAACGLVLRRRTDRTDTAFRLQLLGTGLLLLAFVTGGSALVAVPS